MKALMIVGLAVVMASIARGVLAGSTTAPSAATASESIAQPDGYTVGDRYVAPALPDPVVDQLPAAERTGDRYLAERIALADLIIGEHILAAEDLANHNARQLPGFTEVLLADGFRQDADGAWFYDHFSSWLRFPLSR